MGDIVYIGRKRCFTLEEARDFLPVVRRVTERSIQEVEAVRRRHTGSQGARELDEFESELNEVLKGWSDKVQTLGCEPKGLWLVDFDNGAGYFCWRYPEPEIEHSHGYEDGYSNRSRLK